MFSKEICYFNIVGFWNCLQEVEEMEQSMEKTPDFFHFDLEQIKQEMTTYALELGLISKEDLTEWNQKLGMVQKMVVKDYVSWYGHTDIGAKTIEINVPGCLVKGSWFLYETVFHELAHYESDIHQELYLSRDQKATYIKKILLKKMGLSYGEPLIRENPLLDAPNWGFILLDEVVAQMTAEMMVTKKFGPGIYPGRRIISSNSDKRKERQELLTDPELELETEINAYPEYYAFAEKFSKTLHIDSMAEFCSKAMHPGFVDWMISQYEQKEEGLFTLYQILSYMGMIAKKDYHLKKAVTTLPSNDPAMDPKNVYQAMVMLNQLLDHTLEKETTR